MNYRIIFDRKMSNIEKTSDVADDKTIFRKLIDAKKAVTHLMREDIRMYKEAIGRIYALNASDIPDPQEG